MIGLVMAAAVAGGDVTWLTGDWVDERPGVTTRETWLPLRDGVIAEVGQTIRPGRPSTMEFAYLSWKLNSLTFTALVDGQPPTPFVLKPDPAGRLVFENLAHDFPQRVIYWRCDADLCARIEGMVGGKLQGQDWRYRRVAGVLGGAR
jgi:hypothetical protein